MAASRSLASELRPVLDRADAAPWASGRNQGDDRAAATWAAARRGTSAVGDRVGVAVGLRRRGGGATSDGHRRAAAPAAQPAAGGRQPAQSVRAAATRAARL